MAGNGVDAYVDVGREHRHRLCQGRAVQPTKGKRRVSITFIPAARCAIGEPGVVQPGGIPKHLPILHVVNALPHHDVRITGNTGVVVIRAKEQRGRLAGRIRVGLKQRRGVNGILKLGLGCVNPE